METLAASLFGIVIVAADAFVVQTVPFDSILLATTFALTFKHAIQCIAQQTILPTLALVVVGIYAPCIMYAIYYRFVEPVGIRLRQHAQYEAIALRHRANMFIYAYEAIIGAALYTITNVCIGAVLVSLMADQHSTSWALVLNVMCLTDLISTTWIHDACVRGLEPDRGHVFNSVRWYFWYAVKASAETRCCSIRWPLLDTLMLSDPPASRIQYSTDWMPYVWHIMARDVPVYVEIDDQESEDYKET